MSDDISITDSLQVYVCTYVCMQMTFKLGLSYLPLANAGLDALEVWSSELPPDILHPHFKHILPYLDDYLRTLSNVAGACCYVQCI